MMKKASKILLLVLLAVIVVHSIAVAVLYFFNAHRAKLPVFSTLTNPPFDFKSIPPKARADNAVTNPELDQKIRDQIEQLDAANIAADLQRFYQNHPEVKNRSSLGDISDKGIPREFDRDILLPDVSALSKICHQISADTNSSVRISTITDHPEICGIVHVEKLGDTSSSGDCGGGSRRLDRIYQYEMTDSKQKPFGVMSYLAISWIKKSRTWTLESAISTGMFFLIEKKP